MVNTIVLLLLAALFYWLGYGLYRQHRIELLHTYHYKHVADKNKNAYCQEIGLGLFILATSLLISGLAAIWFDFNMVSIIYIIGLVGLFLAFADAQRRYNDGKWFR